MHNNPTSSAQKVGTLRRVYPLPRGYVVEFRLGRTDDGVATLAAEWTPRLPSRKHLAAWLLAQRRGGAEVADERR